MKTNVSKTIARIAKEHLGIETLEVRKRDSLDFHDVGVAGLADALRAAYEAGRAELLDAAEALLDARDNQMVTSVEWQNLQRAVKKAGKHAAKSERPKTYAAVINGRRVRVTIPESE